MWKLLETFRVGIFEERFLLARDLLSRIKDLENEKKTFRYSAAFRYTDLLSGVPLHKIWICAGRAERNVEHFLPRGLPPQKQDGSLHKSCRHIGRRESRRVGAENASGACNGPGIPYVFAVYLSISDTVMQPGQRGRYAGHPGSLVRWELSHSGE